MRVAVLDAEGRIVNIIEASSVERAAEFYEFVREAKDGDSIAPGEIDPDAQLRAQFEADKAAAAAAEFAAYKARQGAPSYKAASVKIAAEKLGLLDTITAAIMALVDKSGDKSLHVWWQETDAISRGDAQWQEIEAAVEWGKGASADDLFALAAQI